MMRRAQMGKLSGRACRRLMAATAAWLGMVGAHAEEADLTGSQDPLYVQLSTCLMGSLTEHALAQARRDGVSIETQRARYRAQIGENARMEDFLTQLYATEDASALLVELNSRCVAGMVGLPQAQAAACYRQYLLPLYTAIMAPHTGGLDTTTPKRQYLACMKRTTKTPQ
ncbi:hypothetical protein GO286_04221 [Ralstonia solanacearum]|nr:hypothetical protein [Ralstonia solanacearum]